MTCKRYETQSRGFKQDLMYDSALLALVCMPICRSTTCLAQRPSFRSTISRSVCDSEEKLQPHYLLSKRTQATFFFVSFQKHPEPFFALARELYPGQFKPFPYPFDLSGLISAN
uniref:Uncharacterized protein n=2 Tax=Sinocyclocheilus grahami TaxID=75366 RepID=A0A672L0V9_SINGR